MKTYTNIILLLILYAVGFAQQTDTTKEFTNYRRTDSHNFPSPEKYSQPKEQIFPLGYGTNHYPKGQVGKVMSGTGIWTELNPKVPRVDYLGIHFVNKDTGWACGGSGAIIKTTNGGNNWTISETPVTNLLLKIHSYNGQIVIATGYDGIILRSSDAGETFEQVVSGVGSGIDLWGVKMLNDTLGWACGMNQTLLKTTDAGLSWQLINAGLNQHYWSIDFLPAPLGNEHYGMIACGGGKILKTTDGGNSWAAIQAGDTRALYTIDIIDSLHIAVGGATGKNCYSSDGGLTWIQNTNLIYENGVNSLAFINTDTAYAVGEQWAIRKTTNRGVSWFASAPVYAEWQLNLLEGGIGYAAGNSLRIYKTENGYDNWEKLFFTDNFRDVFFIDENRGFIIVSDPAKLYKTTDGGLSWDSIPGAPGGADLLFLDELTGFIGSNLIYKTTDGGENWYITQGSGGTTKIIFINPLIGWSVGGKNIYKTTDGGESWFVQFTHINDSFTSIFFVDSLNGWATSRYVHQTTDGGLNWIERTDIGAFFSDDVYFIDNVGFIIEFLKLYKTTDSGNNWFTQLNSQYIIRSFGWLDNHRGFIIGDGVYITTNTGENWEEILELRNVGLRKFHSPKNYIGYSVGNHGLIYKYIDSSYVPVELISFTGFYDTEKIILSWKTASEINNRDFEIQKSKDRVNWQSIGFVKGSGSSTELHSYSFIDNSTLYEKNYYRLKQIDYNGSYEYSNIIEVSVRLSSYQLYQNYPNPFNPITTIKYSTPEKSFIKISLYDVKGEKVADLINEEKEAGIYKFELNSKNLSSGVYLYRMTSSNGYNSSKKLIILK